MDDEKLYEEIEKYLSGQMPTEEEKTFKARIETDNQLAAEVLLHQGMVDAIQEKEEIIDLKDKIGGIFEANSQKEYSVKKLKPTKNYFLRIAATVVLLLTFGFLILYYINSSSAFNIDQVFADKIDYPQSIDVSSGSRASVSGDADQDSIQQLLENLWFEADQQYQADAFPKALNTLNQVAELETIFFSKTSSDLHYHRAIVYMQLSNFPDAIKDLEKVESDYTEEAKWKRSLILLAKMEQQEKAIRLLKEIATNGLLRKDAAATLLDQLEEPKASN